MDIQINTDEELYKLLSEVSMLNTALDFKWKFIVEKIVANDALSATIDGWFVSVQFERPDTKTGVIGIGQGRREFVAIGTTESGVVKTCWLLIELVIKHELMEAFHWRGKRIFNPHNSIYDLAKIQG